MAATRSKTTTPRTRLPGPDPEVTTTRQPVTRCEACGDPVTYRPGPGNANAALTGHYARKHLG